MRIVMEKAREFNVPLFMALIDYKKAFDSANHSKLWAILKKMCIDNTVIQLLMSLYNEQEAAVRMEGELSAWFNIRKGVRQGCLISPMLFNLYSEEVMRESADDLDSVGININGRCINNLRYADDIVLIATTATMLQELLDKVEEASRAANLEISTRKTKVMTTAASEVMDIQCRGQSLNQVERFKYLGSAIGKTGDANKEIMVRLGTARSALKSLVTLWRDRALPKRLKLTLIKTLIWPIALYGAETWTLRASDVAKLEAFEMTCYRRILRISRSTIAPTSLSSKSSARIGSCCPRSESESSNTSVTWLGLKIFPPTFSKDG